MKMQEKCLKQYNSMKIKNTDTFSFRMSNQMKKRIKLIAKANETNSSEVVRYVLEQSLETLLCV
jgi:predicted DNA-binding protein